MSLSNRTVAYPHRVFNKASIYLLDLKPTSTSSSYQYQGSTTIDSSTLSVEANSLITPKDGKVFDYILSRIQALGMSNTTIELDTNDVLDEFKENRRTENRDKIIDSYAKLLDLQVSLIWNGGSIQFKLLEAINDIDGNHTKELVLSQSFIDAMDENQAKTRYINIGYTSTINTKYTLELAKVLQMDGKGVVKDKGTPIPVQNISHERLCQFLNLDVTSKSVQSQLRKSFTELHNLGYVKYTYNGRRNLWKIHK